MLTQFIAITKAILSYQLGGVGRPSVGEISRFTNIPYSTVSRRLERLVALKLVKSEFVEYKSTGKYEFSLTLEGHDFVYSQYEISL